jgi:hypothetical protein
MNLSGYVFPGAVEATLNQMSQRECGSIPCKSLCLYLDFMKNLYIYLSSESIFSSLGNSKVLLLKVH